MVVLSLYITVFMLILLFSYGDQLESDFNSKVAGSLNTISPPAMPSIRLSDALELKAKKMRRDYGGKGDKMHLGGFRIQDYSSRSNNTWNFMMGHLGVKSLVDVGCGVGISTEYFLNAGAKVLCIEGSHDAVNQTHLPNTMVIEHDFTRGAYWPNDLFDAAWSVEFVEHVGRQFHKNYLPTFRRAALIFMTASGYGGWHHSEIRPNWWWISRMQIAGFIYSHELTNLIRANARSDFKHHRLYSGYASYIATNMMVFINPIIANLPQFEHLISGHGCKWENEMVPCDKRFKWFNPQVDVPPKQHQALLYCVNSLEKIGKKARDWGSGPWDCERNPAAFEE